MKLVYAWIEKFRNINKCGFSFSPEYNVEISTLGVKNINEKEYSVISFDIIKNQSYINIFDEKIDIVSVIAGKNGTGKSNLISAIAELHESFSESQFAFIYINESGEIYIECNQICVQDLNGKIYEAIQGAYQPETTFLKVNYTKKSFARVDTFQKRSNETEYILIKEKTNGMTYPNANAVYSYINRFGLDYKRKGLFYKFKYFLEGIGRSKDVTTKYLSLDLEIDKTYRYRHHEVVKFVPDTYPNEKCLFDFYGSCELYKKAFLLRLIELKISEMRFIDDEIVKEQMRQLHEISELHNGDINELYKHFNKIQLIVYEIHQILTSHNMNNQTNSKLCYEEFYEKIKAFIELLPVNSFENSYKISVSFDYIAGIDELKQKALQLLEMLDMTDICLDYIPQVIDVQINNLPEGMEYLSNIYASIHKCLSQNGFEEYNRIILVLDEPDVHLHPEWSRRLINDIIKFLHEEFPTIKFQLIISTHSPFLLSDVATQNTILLKTDENGDCCVIENRYKENTFGQNIHTLFKSIFFMDSTIGEFATIKINELFNAMQPELSDDGVNEKYPTESELIKKLNLNSINELRNRIDVIGEQIIKDKLYDMLDMCIYNGTNKEQQKLRIKSKIKRLDKQLERLGEN